MRQLSLGLADIKDVLLVGGSTRVPAVKEMVKEIFKKDPVTTVNVDEAVCLRCIIILSNQRETAEDLTPTTKSIHSKNQCIGRMQLDILALLATEFKHWDKMFNSILIAKNQKIPCEVTKTYYTSYDGQELQLIALLHNLVLETEDPDEWVEYHF